MLNRFLQELRSLVGDDAAHKHYLMAVSGGADSMVAASLFHMAGLSFAIAHCNFHLRGIDSDRDMHFVEKAAEKWQVPFHLREFDTSGIQKNSGKSIEMVARELRYAWFEEISADFDYIVTAHQATDAAETMLLNLCRGTGLKGLCGIPPKNGKIIRPMLTFTAEEIRQYAENQHIEYVIDYTNNDEHIARNRIRHSVIPQLEHLNSQFLQTNTRTRSILQQQYAYYQKHIDSEIEKIAFEEGNRYCINRARLAEYEDRALVLYELLSRFGFSSDTSLKLAEYDDFQPGILFLSESHILLVDRDFLIIKPKSEEKNPIIEIESLDDIKQHFDLEEFVYQKDMIFDNDPAILYIPKEKLQFPLQIRPWKHGDFFYPLGGKGRQKLSDFFTDHKIDRFSKDQIRLLCSKDNILWIIGLRSDERWKVWKEGSKCYKIRLPLNPPQEGDLPIATGGNPNDISCEKNSPQQMTTLLSPPFKGARGDSLPAGNRLPLNPPQEGDLTATSGKKPKDISCEKNSPQQMTTLLSPPFKGARGDSKNNFAKITPDFLRKNNIYSQNLIFSNNYLPYNPNLKQRSRNLRSCGVMAEALLWKHLRGKQTGYIFQRQKPILNYIVDFYCKELNLVVEIDGAAHFSAEAQEYDHERDRQLQVLGLTVVRVKDSDVRDNAEHVARCIIEQYGNNKLPLNPPQEGDLPIATGGKPNDISCEKNSPQQMTTLLSPPFKGARGDSLPADNKLPLNPPQEGDLPITTGKKQTIFFATTNNK